MGKSGAKHLMTQLYSHFGPLTTDSDNNCQPSNVTFRGVTSKEIREFKYLLTYQALMVLSESWHDSCTYNIKHPSNKLKLANKIFNLTRIFGDTL